MRAARLPVSAFPHTDISWDCPSLDYPVRSTTTMDPRSDIQALKEKIEELELDIKELKRKNVKLEADLGAILNPEERMIIRQQIVANTKRITALDTRITALDTRITEYQRTINATITASGNIPRHLSFQILSSPWFEFLNSISIAF